MKVFIVIAAYNEEKSIVKVLKDLKRHKYNNIVVVDDGSRDHTYDEALKENVHVLRHIINRGQGATLKTGIDYALKNGADIIITFDADGQHSTEDLAAMIRPVEKKECDVTLGSRFLKKTNMPLIRQITLKIGIFVLWLFYGVKMTDAHNGLRAMSRVAAKKIEINSDRMEHASQIVEEIHKKKIRYKEIPVTIKYTNYSIKHGHGNFIEGMRVLTQMIIRKMTK
jgi:glycosyltransferase involved in cell wall biosynthesis